MKPLSLLLGIFLLSCNPIEEKTKSTFDPDHTPFLEPKPYISSIVDRNLAQNTSAQVNFTISSSSTPLTCSQSVRGASSNTSILSPSDILIHGTAPNCTATITPLLNRTGKLVVTLKVTNGIQASQTTFNLNVEPSLEFSGYPTLKSTADPTYARTIDFTTLSINEEVDMVEVCLSEDVDLNNELSTAELCNTQNWLEITSLIGADNTNTTTGWSDYSIKDGIDGADFSASLVPSCLGQRRYVTTIRVRSHSSGVKKVISTPAWSFWSPSCLNSSMAIWLDASDAQTVFTTSSCTVSVINGDKVGCWKDKSPNGRDVTQSSSTNQPTYLETGLNANRPGLSFSGDVLQTANVASWLNDTPYTLVAIGTLTSINKTERNYFFGTNTPTFVTRAGLQFGRRNSTHHTIAQFSNDVDFPFPEVSNLNIHIGQKASNSSNSTFYAINGTNLTPTVTNVSGFLFTYNPLNVGAGFNHSTATMEGTFGEGMIFTSALSVTDIEKIEGYLAWKWGSDELPLGHPYKFSPP